MTNITVIVVRPLFFRGERIEADTRLDAEPAEAAALIDSGRARLHRQADASLLDEARRADAAKALRTAGRPVMQPHDDPRWRAQ